jgi:hypothetical protein
VGRRPGKERMAAKEELAERAVEEKRWELAPEPAHGRTAPARAVGRRSVPVGEVEREVAADDGELV